MVRRLGIDEAGRGCVLGPLVFGAVLVDADAEAALHGLGARDSKALTARRREEVGARIRAATIWSLRAIEPELLDARSLHAIGSEAICELIEALQPDEVVLDAPVAPPGIPRWVASLRERLGPRLRIVAENKADVRHPVCAAASVIAKVERDARLAALQVEAGAPLGSGYPSDPVTIAWLERTWRANGRFPPFVRHKWQTVQRLIGGPQGVLF